MSQHNDLTRRQLPGQRGRDARRGAPQSRQDANANHIANAPTDAPLEVKQIKAGLLDVGYAEAGPANGPPVVLLHGWPYDIHSYADVADLLGAKGYRVIIPHLRGYGTTRFLSDETVRNGQQSAFAVDTIELMDALGIKQAIVGGFDWGRAPPPSSARCGRSGARRSCA